MAANNKPKEEGKEPKDVAPASPSPSTQPPSLDEPSTESVSTEVVARPDQGQGTLPEAPEGAGDDWEYDPTEDADVLRVAGPQTFQGQELADLQTQMGPLGANAAQKIAEAQAQRIQQAAPTGTATLGTQGARAVLDYERQRQQYAVGEGNSTPAHLREPRGAVQPSNQALLEMQLRQQYEASMRATLDDQASQNAEIANLGKIIGAAMVEAQQKRATLAFPTIGLDEVRPGGIGFANGAWRDANGNIIPDEELTQEQRQQGMVLGMQVGSAKLAFLRKQAEENGGVEIPKEERLRQ